ncbi:hypothetical protein [Gimesia panareensis]|uniref:Uncharacterized protein n=1 Tax=Gimesia panareensis TaxID=2527978 RepID=A0A518FSV5_9PLAN|nr:hypothetical protein [Gimesia panareensis]QDT28685.1 hypothetical protein Enr10x_40290 [Gimesia panareensis]QDU51538.1 hypothetical protein Pan110_39040 [Gimesia panareensis]QDV19427.1 hypothetical protein Pan153_40920 [Gimesia panareensis]
MPDPTSEAQSEPQGSTTGFLSWLLISLVLMTALSLLAVHLPERLKLLLVYAVVYGLIAGGMLATLAVKSGLTVTRSLLSVIVLLTISGQCLVLYLSHQRYQEATQRQFKLDQTALVIDRMFAKGEPPEDPQARKEYDQVLKQFQAAKKERQDKEQRLLKISSYLEHRLSPVARLDAPWPLLFWLLELTLCSAAAVWAGRQVAQPASPETEPAEQDSSES